MRGILIERGESGSSAGVAALDEGALPEGDVLIDVSHSSINYKDALAITGKGPVVRSFPMVPGIDLAGVVRESSSALFSRGDSVLVNGWGLGETRWGGLADLARVKGDWLVPLPERYDPRAAMAIGTAGYTAMLCVMALEEQGVTPDQGEILVSGATGGVGSVAVVLLAQRGYRVVALTGRPEEAGYLSSLGAAEILDGAQYAAPGKPLARERWAGAIDTTGGTILANICAAMKYGGTVAACGLAQSMDFPGSVAPFILRGVTLAGIDSVYTPIARRMQAWARLAAELAPQFPADMVTDIGLPEVVECAASLLDRKIRGRIVVEIGR